MAGEPGDLRSASLPRTLSDEEQEVLRVSKRSRSFTEGYLGERWMLGKADRRRDPFSWLGVLHRERMTGQI